MKSTKMKVGEVLQVCLHPGLDDNVPQSWTQVFWPMMENDSSRCHDIMKILCNPYFIGYKVIKQQCSQLLLSWEVLMMLCSKCHGCCPNGGSVPSSVSKQKLILHTRGLLKPLLYLDGEWTSPEQKIIFPPTDRLGEREMIDIKCFV
jgi:hypothetical protein